MIRMLGFLSLVLAALMGFGMGSGFFIKGKGAQVIAGIHPEKEVPLTQFKSFAVFVYAQNDADWCERSLRSIFSQDYEDFRLLFVDDGSSDATLERVRNFIIANAQQDRVLVMHNETPLGFTASLERAVSHCLDREVVVPLCAKNWMVSPNVLSHWNLAFQNSDVWVAFGRSIAYPSYEFREPPAFNLKEVEKKGWGPISSRLFSSHCFYSALFKKIAVQNLQGDYLSKVLEIAAGRVKNIGEPIHFVNETDGIELTP